MLRTILILTALIVFSGKVFAGDSSDVVWQKEYSMYYYENLIISTDNKYLATNEHNTNNLRIIDAETGDIFRDVEIDSTTYISSLSFFPGNDRIALTLDTKINLKWYSSLAIYSISENKILKKKTIENGEFRAYRYCDVSSDGTVIVTCADKKTYENVWINDAETLESIKKLDVGRADYQPCIPNIVKISPTGKYIVALAHRFPPSGEDVYRVVRIWNTETWERFQIDDPIIGENSNDVAFSEDEKHLAVTTEWQANIYDIDNKSIISDYIHLGHHTNVILNEDKVAISYGGITIFNYNNNEKCYFYDWMIYDVVMTKDKKFFYARSLVNNSMILQRLNARWEADGINEAREDVLYVEINPNPVSSQATIKFLLAAPVNVECVIHDILGNKVKEIASEYYSSGENSIPFSKDELARGIYFVVLNLSDGRRIEQKFVIE